MGCPKDIKNIKNYFELDLKRLREQIIQYNDLSEKNITKAEATINERLADMNKFREQLKEIMTSLATTVKVDSVVENFNMKIDNLKSEIDALKKAENIRGGRNALILLIYPVILTIIFFMLNRYLK